MKELLIPILLLALILLISPVPARSDTVNQYLFPHNLARRQLRLTPLKWDPKLAAYAARYANKRRADCARIHSDGPYGENLFWGAGTKWAAAQAVAGWMSERKWYNYGMNKCFGPDCGHYTQIVWRSTRRVGCAKVSCLNGRGVLFVCEYDPPGH
ncbi:hypothetical protein V2J09_002972 [Rumex salicifolius]